MNREQQPVAIRSSEVPPILKARGFRRALEALRTVVAPLAAEKLDALKGHDFSRAATSRKQTRALAPAGRFSGHLLETRPASAGAEAPAHDGPLSARLKSCPFTGPSSNGAGGPSSAAASAPRPGFLRIPDWPSFVLPAFACAAALALALLPAFAQQPAPALPSTPPSASAPPKDFKITPEQAKQLFSLVDELIQFSSQESGLPIKSAVKRQITSRAEVEAYLKQKFDEDEGARRMQRDEIVLKKFGLLDRDFQLKPFLLSLLKEQIEAYYDSKTKTVNMLDWVDIEEQKPVLAHELTHALQDQHSDLEKWNDQTPEDVSTDASGDNDHLAKDEIDTARDAVVEGQATAVMMDYVLKPMGKSLIKDPEVMGVLKQQMAGSDNSPILARAPLLLTESLLFPYRDGLSFEQDVWMDEGQTAAFAGTMDHPPTSTWEILNPLVYEHRETPAVPLLPNIHPLLDKLYKPYDIGQVGQLDLHILATLFGGDAADRSLTPAWDGGLYWAGQRLSATTPAEQASTNALALFYLSVWKNTASAKAFSELYATELGRKYSGLKPDLAAQNAPPPDLPAGSHELVFSTNEGPVLITVRGKQVFVSESFPLDIARRLTSLVLDAQGAGELRMANASQPQTLGAPEPALISALGAPEPALSLPKGPASGTWERTNLTQNTSQLQALGAPELALSLPKGPAFGTWESTNLAQAQSTPGLTSGLIRFLSNCGVMKVAVDAAIRIAK